jgi:hypothetical protein
MLGYIISDGRVIGIDCVKKRLMELLPEFPKEDVVYVTETFEGEVRLYNMCHSYGISSTGEVYDVVSNHESFYCKKNTFFSTEPNKLGWFEITKKEHPYPYIQYNPPFKYKDIPEIEERPWIENIESSIPFESSEVGSIWKNIIFTMGDRGFEYTQVLRSRSGTTSVKLIPHKSWRPMLNAKYMVRVSKNIVPQNNKGFMGVWLVEPITKDEDDRVYKEWVDIQKQKRSYSVDFIGWRSIQGTEFKTILKINALNKTLDIPPAKFVSFVGDEPELLFEKTGKLSGFENKFSWTGRGILDEDVIEKII